MNTNPENPVNPVQDSDSAPLPETGNPKLETPALPATRPLSRLLDLSERQREHVDTWLKERVPFRKIVALCRSEFEKEIPYMTFVRYSNRTHSTLQIEELAASKEVAAELRRYAATGDPTFSAPTLEIFEQMAFDLAVAYNRDHDADDLAIVKQLWPLIHRAKSTTVRERHAAVQERKCDLRAEELALKREIFQARRSSKNNGGTSRAQSASLSPVLECESPTSTSRDEINTTDAASADIDTEEPPFSPLPPVQNPSASSPSTQHSGMLPPETIENNRRYARLLLAGKIQFPVPGEMPTATRWHEEASLTGAASPQPEERKPS